MRRLIAAPVLLVVLLAAACSSAPVPAASAVPPASTADPLSPAAVRASVEREWSVKADKMGQHLLPLMRKHRVDLWPS